ncbi:MAG: agmatine deiminase family protein [Verrucomicrobia bacterium]|nr:agmatine deiminase family protein [Verrucomicrobiota bacterium]MCH8527155.1 agmatine deiminase family protein [Kiritimatiellia bacterium]
MPTPAYRLPAEYEAQSAVWLTWPGAANTWKHCRDELEGSYSALVAVISRFQPVELICRAAWQPHAKRKLNRAKADLSRITFHDWPSNDAWCRDHGPLFVKAPDGTRAVVDFAYNAWGGKFPPWEDDDAIPERVASLRDLPRHRLPIFGEGGAIEINSQGIMLTTESVWLNPNRNPGLTKAGAEEIFKQYLGATEIIWLPGGMAADDTDGHIDTLSRFVNDTTVVSVLPDESDEDYAVLRDNFDRLSERFEVEPLPHPRTIIPDGWDEEVLPATYANFLILNEAVLIPSYRQPGRDEDALHLLHELFPDRKIIPVDCSDIIWEGGAVHCLSMQEAR